MTEDNLDLINKDKNKATTCALLFAPKHYDNK